MAYSPQYAGIPKNGTAQVSVANVNRDGTGALATVYTAGPIGSRIDILNIIATGTTTAGMIRFFISDGSTTRLIKEIPVTAVIPSATTPAFYLPYVFDGGITLQAGWFLKASTHNAETMNIVPVLAGDF